MTLLSLVTGANAAAREAAIAATLGRDTSTAIILEGLPDGNSPLGPALESASLRIIRIAPGCLCCSGNLTMRVTLNRVLRRPPARLFISLSSSEHLEGIRAFLTQPPYNDLLSLTELIEPASH